MGIEFLEASTPYELGLASNLEFAALLYPVYVRGRRICFFIPVFVAAKAEYARLK